VPPRIGTLLVPVPGLSGTVYDVGTTVLAPGNGASVDAFVGGDWLPLQWWERPPLRGGSPPARIVEIFVTVLTHLQGGRLTQSRLALPR
jgi:hypothetical protein